MPVYEYACGKCEREFEVEQRITDPPVKSCPHCRSRKVKRLISQTSFVLKGGGWYSDLYSTPKKDAKPEGKDDAGGDAAGKGEKGDKKEKKKDGGGKSETKAAPKDSGKPKAAA